ncbi:MAG TPA: DEAD/DEAH box helicase [Myxococcota bacterium]|nr:DEAD/DEAH box helicase [Myxococcota bacterium]
MAGEAIDALFEAMRRASPREIWSRGVELARAEAVRGESERGGEASLRVVTRGGLFCPSVLLSPEDESWDCDCGSRESICEHAVAAVIALRRARREGVPLPTGDATSGHIGYRITRRGGELDFERVVVGLRGEEPLTTTLTALASGRVEGPRFAATQADLAVERALGASRRGALPRGVWPSLLAALAGCEDVTLDAHRVRASATRVGFAARVEDRGPDFVVRVAPDPRIAEPLPHDLVRLSDDTLCLIGEAGLTGREREELLPGKLVEAGRVAELVTEILPALSRRMPVEVATQRLPDTVELPPRIALELEAQDDELRVLPTLVYGDPPRARVDAGRLVPLGGAIPLRDEAEERALTRRLQQDLELVPGHKVALRGAQALALADRIRRAGSWTTLRGRGLERFRREAPLAVRFAARPGGFDLRFISPGADGRVRRADAQRVLRAWQAGEGMVALEGGGGFAELPRDWLEKHGPRVAALLAAADPGEALPRALLPDLARLCEALDTPVPADAAALRRLADQAAEGPPAAALPADLTAELRSYQRRGVDWLCALRDAGLGALLADDMGLGKTLQALCALRGRALVVAPTSVLPNWEEETRRFRPALRIGLYHGPRRTLDPAANVTLTSYAILRLDADALAAVGWDAVVLDESQAIKNPTSQVAGAAYALRAGFRLALTGTPVENRLDELWSQLRFTNPGLLGGRGDFDRLTARKVADGDAEAASRLRERTRPFVLRRTKREVAPELPPRTEVVLHALLSEPERQVYDAVRAATRAEVVEKLAAGASPLQVLEALLRLRQAACHPGLLPGHEAESSSKLELLLESLDECVAEGHKALVFSQWTSLLDRVEPLLRRAALPFTRLDGSTRERGAVVADFQREDGPPVLLISLRAGGTGLNLTAADHVFILDPWWNPAVEDQAADRAHRIGQDRPVMVYRLVAEDTVEERVQALQRRKRELADAALAGAAGALTRDDLLALLD